jgi:hypothetical protein
MTIREIHKIYLPKGYDKEFVKMSGDITFFVTLFKPVLDINTEINVCIARINQIQSPVMNEIKYFYIIVDRDRGLLGLCCHNKELLLEEDKNENSDDNRS